MGRPRTHIDYGIHLALPNVRARFPKEWAIWELMRHWRRLLALLPRCSLNYGYEEYTVASIAGIVAVVSDLPEDVDVRDRIQRKIEEHQANIAYWLTSEQRQEELDAFQSRLAQSVADPEDPWAAALREASPVPNVLQSQMEHTLSEVRNLLSAEHLAVWHVADRICAATANALLPRSWDDVISWGGGTPNPPWPAKSKMPTVPADIGATRIPQQHTGLSIEKQELIERALQAVPPINELWYRELVRRWRATPLPEPSLPTWHAQLATETYLRRVINTFWTELAVRAQFELPRIKVFTTALQIEIDGVMHKLKPAEACFVRALAQSGKQLDSHALLKALRGVKNGENLSRLKSSLNAVMQGLVTESHGIYSLNGNIEFVDA